MKKYIEDYGEFMDWIEGLKYNEFNTLYVEDDELSDNNPSLYSFYKMMFSGTEIVLYDNPAGSISILQDTPVAPYEDYAEIAWEGLVGEDEEYKLYYIEEE